VLADSEVAYLDAVPRALAAHQITVLATATTGHLALTAINEHQPTVAILNPELVEADPAFDVAFATSTTRFILYMNGGQRENVLDAFDAGVRGFVLKEAPLDDLVRAAKTVAAGGVYIDPLLASMFINRHTEHLTPREREILRLLADGHQYKSIGQTLSISPNTVREHASRATRKLRAGTTTQAVARALHRRLIT
jgi:DNA-binding NarL/FixJ family response regulator